MTYRIPPGTKCRRTKDDDCSPYHPFTATTEIIAEARDLPFRYQGVDYQIVVSGESVYMVDVRLLERVE